MKTLLRGILLASIGFSVGAGQAETVDLNRPLKGQISPDLLYLSFDEESSHALSNEAALGVAISLEPGMVDSMPRWHEGRNTAFGKALEFHYGDLPPFGEANDKVAGNHLKIGEHPSFNLAAGEDFTLGFWLKIPDASRMPTTRPYKKLIGKGAYSATYPGWALQLSENDRVWYVSFLTVSEDHVLSRYDAKIDGDLSQGDWRHLGISYNAGAKEIKRWVDGLLVSTQKIKGEIGASQSPLVIGENGMSSYSTVPVVIDDLFVTSGVHEFLPREE